MLADTGPARAAILPILGDVALAPIAERDDAEPANGPSVAAIPENFSVFARRAGQRVNADLGDGPVAILRPSKSGLR
jgi:hypothetical protein